MPRMPRRSARGSPLLLPVSLLTLPPRPAVSQKLQEEGFVEKTLRKYEGKLFLLWRQLEKAYKVKWSPPATILEQLDDDF
jgi:hypothetical protein